MRNNPVFTSARVSGWLLTFIVVVMVLALGGKLGAVLSNGVYALTVLAGIAIVGGLLARMNGPAAPAPARDDMRALIAPFYATLRRTVPRGEDEPGEENAGACEFDAATASVVLDEADGYPDATGRPVQALKRYARSPEGEYFWMVLEVGAEGAPRLAFIKHVPNHVARYALGDKYIAPPTQARPHAPL